MGTARAELLSVDSLCCEDAPVAAEVGMGGSRSSAPVAPTESQQKFEHQLAQAADFSGSMGSSGGGTGQSSGSGAACPAEGSRLGDCGLRCYLSEEADTVLRPGFLDGIFRPPQALSV
ncbi:MAG: hypothetical protein KDA89_03765 [Planctomycetaceae bacterium]|nr:hypothetical protein [Planctomycetaceae bacterium]